MNMRRSSDNLSCSEQDLFSPDEETRRSAVASMARHPLAETGEFLLMCMGDRSWRVRKEAVEVLLSSPEAGSCAEKLFALLRSPDNAGLRNSAVEAMLRLGKRAIPVLESHAGDADGDVRKFVIDILGGIGDESSLPLLVRSLDDPDPNVRASAAENLGKPGFAGGVQPLLAALARPDMVLRHTILEALGKTGGPVPAEAVVPFLSEGLLKKAVYRCLGYAGGPDAAPVLVRGLDERSRSVREAALKAVMELRERNPGGTSMKEIDARLQGPYGAQLLEGLLALQDSGEFSIRRALVSMLGLIGDPRGAAFVMRACGDERLFRECVHALRSLGAETGPILEREFFAADEALKAGILRICGKMELQGGHSLILKGMGDPAPQVREAAVRAAGRSGLARLVPDVALLLDDLDQDVRTAAMESLALLSTGAASLVAEIASNLSATPEPDKRRVAAYLCGVLRDGERLALLMKDEDHLVRKSAIQGMALVGSEDAVQHLTLSLTDENPDVRIAAAAALGETGREDALEPLALIALDEDPWVRCAALRSLGRIGGREALDVIETSLGDADGLVSLAALDALGRIGGDRSLELIRRAVGSGDDEVVKSAISILTERGDRWLDLRAEELLRHPHWDVRNAVVGFLALSRGEGALPILRRALENESDDLVKGRIIEVLERLT